MYSSGRSSVKKKDTNQENLLEPFEEFAILKELKEPRDIIFPYSEQDIRTAYIRAALYSTIKRSEIISTKPEENKPKETLSSNEKKENLEEKIAWVTIEKLLKIGEKGYKNKKLVLYQLDNDLSYISDFLENISNQLNPPDNIKFEYHEREKGNHIHCEVYGRKVEIQSKKRFENAMIQGKTASDALELYVNYIILNV